MIRERRETDRICPGVRTSALNMGPAARSTRRRPHIGQRVRRQGETGRTPTWKRRETLSLEEHVGLFFRTCGKTIQGKCRRRSLRKKGGRRELNRIRT